MKSMPIQTLKPTHRARRMAVRSIDSARVSPDAIPGVMNGDYFARRSARKRARSRKPDAHPQRATLSDIPESSEMAQASRARYVGNCPACEGCITDDDTGIFKDPEAGVHASMICPHCGHRESKQLCAPALRATSAQAVPA